MINMSYIKTVIGIIGASKVSKKTAGLAESLGKEIAKQGWVTLTGGEPNGVMDLALKGAVKNGGNTIGILSGVQGDAVSQYVEIPIFTDAGLARDYFNILSSQVVVVVGKVSDGTLVEVAYAVKKEIPLVLLNVPKFEEQLIFKRTAGKVSVCKSVTEVVKVIEKLLDAK